MAYDKYVPEFTDKDGQIYGVMDEEAREEVAALNSALNDKADNVDIFGGERFLPQDNILSGKEVTNTDVGNTINIGNDPNKLVVIYDVTSLRGKSIKVYTYNDVGTNNFYTDANGIVISRLVSGTAERTSTVPPNAVYLYLTNNKNQESTYIKYTVEDYVVKDIEDLGDHLENELSTKVEKDEIYVHGDSIEPDNIIDGKEIGYTSSGAPVLNNDTTKEVVVWDVSQCAGKKLILKNNDAGARNYWCDSSGNVMTGLASGTTERTIYGLAGAKYLYVTNVKASGEAYLKISVTDTIGNNAAQGAFRMSNMLMNPYFENATNWVNIVSVSDGIATLSDNSNLQLEQKQNPLVFDEGDLIYCRAVIDEIENVNYSFFTIQGITTANSGNFGYHNILHDHDLLELQYPVVVSSVVTAPASYQNGRQNRFLLNFVRESISTSGTARLHGVACINLTKAFGQGNEPNSSTIDMILDGMDHGTFDGDINITNTEFLLRGAKFMPKNSAGFSVDALGYCMMKSVINPNWSGWNDYWNAYGKSSTRCPIPNQVHGELETDAMFSVVPKFGRWSGWSNGSGEYGGHVFEGWTLDHYSRLTMIMGLYHQDEANIIVYHPNDPEGDPAHFGVVRIGADLDKNGFVFGKQFQEAYGNMLFSKGFAPIIKSQDGTQWKLKVANDGTLSTEQVNIPMRDET